MERKTIFLDMDGVLNNLGRNFCTYIDWKYNNVKWFDPKYGYDMSKWFSIDGKSSVEAMLEAFNDRDFWKNLTINKVLYNAIASLDILNRHDVYICTFPSGWSVCAEEKALWVEKYFPQIDTSKQLIMMKDKYLLAGNGILIDDCPDNVKNFIDNNGEAFLYKTFYNYKSTLPAIYSLYDLKGYI